MNDLQRIKPIFEQALDREGSDRRAYLDEECGHEPELRRKVEALLKAHEGAGRFLESPVFEAELSPGESPLSEGPGTVIGRYKLLEKIGEGGMAVVYMAEQQEPIRRKVALKIIKLGMDTRQVIARFEAERQALALMDHPSIAKVLDAGATETGRPYFVMELVTGVSITEYCDKNSLSTKDRLALFLQVCHAVQHAHQKGIIHRDLKPSNVMVTHHDGQPIPKVIDFGIAKATNQRLTEKTLFTRYAHLIGTPAYMSPEQAELSDLNIDTRTDIYSLGVLLYELLTGTTPFSEEELRKAGYIEMQRVIREQEPDKPSTRIRTALRRASVPARRSSMGVSPVKVGPRWPCDSMGGTPMLREVRGDLDWIVMKSLEKDRARRYETANGLAEDIRRHLEHEPVLARGPSSTYRLRKFLRRHQVQVLVGLTVGVLIALATIILFQWGRDRQRLAEAEGIQRQAQALQDKEILSQARRQYAQGQREAALRTIQRIFASAHAGPEARLLGAGILAEDGRVEEATALLGKLLGEGAEIAGAAHALLARILWASQSAKAEKAEEIKEHRRQAEALLPETAEAYFLRAITAVTIKEQLVFLGGALQLASRDPDPLSPINYESRRLRAFIYYASRKYEKMRDDAFAMTILRPSDPLGYSLHATALRELGQYQEAIAAYDSALALVLKDDPQYLDLTTQRVETLLRMGSYQPAIVAAQEALRLWPDRPIFQYDLFAAQTALGDYDAAVAVSERIISPGPEARRPFEDWCTKYMFDRLHAGRSWHPPDRTPVGAAFLPLVEAEETYQHLAAKAKRVIINGHTTRWSPDGKKLVFSPGVPGNSGVAVFDPATNETELLIVPGKDPAWSPDGRYIAFVRDCQALRVPEFATAERKPKPRPRVEEEVWVMNADGTEPRLLARGGWPSWSQDSQRVYYHSHVDKALCSISLAGHDATGQRLMACTFPWPSVSPDGQRVAYPEGGLLKVKDLASQAVVAQWTVPPLPWLPPAWSPTGRELCMGTSASKENRVGLWVFGLDGSQPLKVLDSQITIASWAPDGTKLVFHLGAPYFEIWTADLDPKVPLFKALGPGQAVRDHYRQTAALYTRRIEADPLDAEAYLQRAQQYHFLHQERKVQADMRQYTAIVTQGKPLEAPSVPPWDAERVINGPFGYQLVFSVEQRESALQVLNVAFGQKGKGSMKSFEIPMVVTSLVGLSFLAGLDALPARADFTFGEPVDLGPGINHPVTDNFGQGFPCISPDGLELYFCRSVPGAAYDIFVARRPTVDSEWGEPVNLGPTVNSSTYDWRLSISADGLSLYYTYGGGGAYPWRLYVTKRATKDAPWGPPASVGGAMATVLAWGPSIAPNELELYFCSPGLGGYGGDDIWVTTRPTVNDPWGPPANLGPAVNSPYGDIDPVISPDGLLLFFSSRDDSGRWGTYVTRRATKSDLWRPRMYLGSILNPSGETGTERPGGVSFDGSMLYVFCSIRRTIWQAPIIPIVDFNGDGKVDAADMVLFVANWGKSTSLCDIGPFPWGDGVVDEKDLRVLTESLMTPGPHASDVPCDVVLSWISPSFAPACDVYFGTSREAVNNADRTNPQGVLVSLAQAATAYAPAELLEYSRTYYWRVDFVIPGPTPTIYPGPVLTFTTEAFAYPIKNITAKASSFQSGMGPEKTVDGSGLDKSDGHSTDGKDMWFSAGTQPHWIQYQFDKVYALQELWVWNSNQAVEPFIGFGAKTVKIEYSTDGTTWTPLANVPEFARATGQPGYAHNTTVSFSGVSAKYVKLTIEKGWGATPSTGLSEVRFFYIPTAAVPKP